MREWSHSRMLITIMFLLIIRSVAAENASFHFVLVHGAGHGAWCWYKVTERLQKSGYKVDAIDLLSAGVNTAEVQSVTTLEGYSTPLIQLLQNLADNEKVVLVGHSLGGASVTYAMEKFAPRISVGIYVAGLMLPPGPDALTVDAQLLARQQLNMVETSQANFDLNRVQNLLYNLSPPQDVVLAKALLKPVPSFDPTVNFTRRNYGSVPRYFVKTKFDNVIQVEDQDLLIRRTPPNGVVEIDSDHAPFFSAVDSLVRNLIKIAHKTAV